MKFLNLNRWDVTAREAVQIQKSLRERLELSDRLPAIRCVAGADLAFDLVRNRAIAGAVIYRFPDMEEIERVRNAPDLIFCDGHGYAHPRRFGITSHLGVLLDTPTIGCAKSILVGTHGPVPAVPGRWTPLEDGGEIVGAVLRTRSGVKPIYVTQGHCVSLATALKFVTAVLDGFRVPRPTRDADHFVAAAKRGECRHGPQESTHAAARRSAAS